MEFLASLAIKTLIGTSICGTVTVGAVYGYDKTLLGFKDNTKNPLTNLGTIEGGDVAVDKPSEGSGIKKVAKNAEDDVTNLESNPAVSEELQNQQGKGDSELTQGAKNIEVEQAQPAQEPTEQQTEQISPTVSGSNIENGTPTRTGEEELKVITPEESTHKDTDVQTNPTGQTQI